MSWIRSRGRPWSLSWALATAMIAVPACGGDATGPSGPLLLGQWGAATSLLVALRSGAEVQLTCAVVIIDDPIRLSAGGRFGVQGRLQTTSAVVGPLPRVRGTGQVSGSRVTLTLPVTSTGTPMTFELESGVMPDPVEIPTCPQ
jgi:hypothetical protein